MARPRKTRPTEAQLRILRVLWNKGPSLAREIGDELRASGEKAINQATLVSAIAEMVERGYVKVVDGRRPFKYAAAIEQEQTRRTLISEMLNGIFGGSVKGMVRSLLGDRTLTEEELSDVAKMIDEMRDRKE